MELIISDKYLSLLFANKNEEEEIKKILTFTDDSLVFIRGSYNPKMIRHICFLKKVKNMYVCRSGFLQEVLVCCKNKSIPITKITDERTRFIHQNKDWDYDELRSFYNPKFLYVEHQIQALKALLKTNVGICKLPTSAGKADIFIALMKATQLPTLIVVNKITLATQLYDRIIKAGLKCGLSTGGGTKIEYSMVSTIGSVKKIPDLHNYKMLVIDEIHRASAKRFQEFLDRTSYPLRFGFSATPEGNDKYKYAKIRQHFGSIIAETKVDELIENNVITKPRIKFIEVQCLPTSTWPMANENCIMFNKNRNKIICDIVEKYRQPTLILVKNIEHGKALQEEIPNSVFLSGIDDNEERIDIINKFEKREIPYIIATNILNEGISINVIRVLIIASGQKSRIETTQKIGRGLRKDIGKTEVLIFDFMDIGNRFTQKHSLIRKNIYKELGFEVEDCKS
jgi:superfamily II DNA or RNA helicase